MRILIILFYLILSLSILPKKSFGFQLKSSTLTVNKSIKDSLIIHELIQRSDDLLYINADSSRFYAKKGMALAIESKSLYNQSSTYKRIGKSYQLQGHYDSALFYSEKSLKIWKQLNVQIELGNVYNNIGIIYDEKGTDDIATEYYIAALEIFEFINDKNGIAKVYNNLGIINKKNKNYKNVLFYYEKSLSIYKQQNFGLGIASTKANIGSVYLDLKKFDESIKYSREAIKGFLESNTKQYISYSYENIGLAYREKGNLVKALKFHKLALKGYQEYGNQKESAFTLTSLSQISIQNKYYTEAWNYANQSLEISKEIGALQEIILGYEALFIADNYLGRPNNAFNNFEKYKILSDSVNYLQHNKVIEEVQTRYETEKKEEQIKVLEAEAQIQNLQLQNNQYMMGGIGITSILIIFSIIVLYKGKNYKLKISYAQEKENQQKLRFKAVIDAEEKERKRIAQELHDGLGQLLSTARLNVSVLEDDDESKNTQVNNSLKLIDDAVNEVRNISHNMMPNALISIGFEAALKEQVHLINDAKKVKAHIDLPNEKLYLEESKAISLYRIIQEILNNALKYSEAQNIWIEITTTDNLLISIKDDGKGFDTKVVGNSTGIGWENIISRTDLLSGTLDIQSEIGKGSEVSLKLAV